MIVMQPRIALFFWILAQVLQLIESGPAPSITEAETIISANIERINLHLFLGTVTFESLGPGAELEMSICTASFDPVQNVARIKGLATEPVEVPPLSPMFDELNSGSPFSMDGKLTSAVMNRGVAGPYPAEGKAISLLQAYNNNGGTPIPSVTMANAQNDAHGRPYPIMNVKTYFNLLELWTKAQPQSVVEIGEIDSSVHRLNFFDMVQMGDPGTGFHCVLHHDITLSGYCNGKLMEGFPNPQFSDKSNLGSDNDITSIINNNQITTRFYCGTLMVLRADLTSNYIIFPIPNGWLLWENTIESGQEKKRSIDSKFLRKKRFFIGIIGGGGNYYPAVLYQLGYINQPDFEKALGMCSIDANPEISVGQGTGLTGPDRFRADSLEQLLELYTMDDYGDVTGAAYTRESIPTQTDDSEIDDSEDDLGSGSEAGGHCPLVTAEVERNFKKTCKVNKKVEKVCGIFTSSAGPLKDCLASTAGTLTMFNAAAAYEECRLSICAKLPAKKLCHILKQQVDLCHKQHVAGGKSHPANALWRSATNCKFDKIKKKGDPNGVVACIDPRERPSCWKPDGCNRLPDIDDSPHECDERMVCNDGYLWNGKKCVKSGSC